MKHKRISTDFLVIGSGLAGLSFARKAAELGDVILVTKDNAEIGCTVLAQGGMAAVLKGEKSLQSHIDDTIRAGIGLCREEIVTKVVHAAANSAYELIDMGVPFDKDEGDPSILYLTKEGGHSEKRVMHVADETGRSMEDIGLQHIRGKSSIKLFEHHTAIDLITEHHLKDKRGQPNDPLHCYGAYIFDERNGEVYTVLSRFTILASGGAGQIYKFTTNPSVATGDGIAMGYLAGALVANMEFIQFHPTTLYDPANEEGESFLISEAMRGEGAYLRLKNGHRFMQDFDSERMELAPRDVVARAIDAVLKKTGQSYVYLDITHRDKDFITKRFPNIYKVCLEKGIDITKDMIPVVPAAHYIGGGLLTDENGETNIANLYAIGEVAYTGLHGANRLASNSLLEAAVFADFAFRHIKDNKLNQKQAVDYNSISDWIESEPFDEDEWVIVSHNLNTLKELMWNYVGIVRNDLRLSKALERIMLIYKEVDEFYRKNPVKRQVIELRNMVNVGWLVIRSALSRTESRGLHYNLDNPGTLPGQPVDTIFRSSRFGDDEHVQRKDNDT